MASFEQRLSQAHANGVVIGLLGSGSVVARLDIDQLLTREPLTFNLFLLALAKLQTQPDKMGYFQIAGEPGLNDGGYCTHGLLTFPTWHRPYVAMLEQSIYKTMSNIVKRDFPNSSNYSTAVSNFRLPFWDPYRPRGGRVVMPGAGGSTSFPYDFKLPQIMTLEQVMVLSKESDQQLTAIRNPLQRFTYPQTGSIPRQQWSWVQAAYRGAYNDSWTTRHPTTSHSSNVASLNQDLNRAREQLVRSMVNCLTDSGYKRWRAFSNHGMTRPTDNIEAGSLEGFHDNYHGIIGGENGHMSIPPVAAFDPVFWLHHCNIDRLFAIWQAVNPSVWWPSQLRQGEPSDDVKLTPFRTEGGGFWTSKSSRDTQRFGYTYSEVGPNPSIVAQEVGRRYNWSQQQFIPPGRQAVAPADMQDAMNTSSAPFFQFNSTRVPDVLKAATTQIAAVANTFNLMASNVVETVAAKTSEIKANVLATDNPLKATHSAGAENPTTGATTVLTSVKAAVGVQDPHPEAQKSLVAQKGKSKIPEGARPIRQWYIDSIADRMALNGTWTIHFFIGAPRPDVLTPAEYANAASLAGIAHFFVSPSQACDNCNRIGQAGAQVSNTTAITPILGDYVRLGQLQSLEPEHVVPFLVKEIQWRVTKAPGPEDTSHERQPVPTASINGFELRVNSDLSYLEQGQFLAIEVGSEVFDEEVIGAIPNGDGSRSE